VQVGAVDKIGEDEPARRNDKQGDCISGLIIGRPDQGGSTGRDNYSLVQSKPEAVGPAASVLASPFHWFRSRPPLPNDDYRPVRISNRRALNGVCWSIRGGSRRGKIPADL